MVAGRSTTLPMLVEPHEPVEEDDRGSDPHFNDVGRGLARAVHHRVRPPRSSRHSLATHLQASGSWLAAACRRAGRGLHGRGGVPSEPEGVSPGWACRLSETTCTSAGDSNSRRKRRLRLLRRRPAERPCPDRTSAPADFAGLPQQGRGSGTIAWLGYAALGHIRNLLPRFLAGVSIRLAGLFVRIVGVACRTTQRRSIAKVAIERRVDAGCVRGGANGFLQALSVPESQGEAWRTRMHPTPDVVEAYPSSR